MRISDWSSDVCSSDLEGNTLLAVGCGHIFVHLREAVGGRRQAGRGGARHQGIGVWPVLVGEVAVEQGGAQHILPPRIAAIRGFPEPRHGFRQLTGVEQEYAEVPLGPFLLILHPFLLTAFSYSEGPWPPFAFSL